VGLPQGALWAGNVNPLLNGAPAGTAPQQQM